jgi:chromosome segregation ATPase
MDPTQAEPRVDDKSTEIKRLLDELTSRNEMYDALKIQSTQSTIDLENARLKVVERDTRAELLREELESVKVRLAEKTAELRTARLDRDVPIEKIDSVKYETPGAF